LAHIYSNKFETKFALASSISLEAHLYSALWNAACEYSLPTSCM